MNMESPAIWAKTMVDLGLKSVVFPLDSTASEELVDAYVKAAKENDLTIAEVGIWRNAISLDDAERKRNFEYSVNQLILADKIGAKCCVNVAGSLGKVWDGGYQENFSKAAWDKTVKMAQELIDEVKPKNTFFTLESMPWMVPTGPKEYMNLIEDVARDEFAAHLDIINMINSAEKYFFRDEFLIETFEIMGKSIKSCHLKDIKLLDGYTFMLKECACGEGDFNLELYASLASKTDKDMPMIIEHLATNDDYIKSVQYVRKRLNV